MPRSFWHLADDARRLPSPAPTRSSNNEKRPPLLALLGHGVMSDLSPLSLLKRT
jgi:hypothetical protein